MENSEQQQADIAGLSARENHLLVASGVLAIALTGGFAGRTFGFWPGSLLYLAFAAVFVTIIYAVRLQLSDRVRRYGLGILVLLSVLTWFVTPMDISLILTVVVMAEAPAILSRRTTWLLMLAINVAFLAVFLGYWQAQDVLGTWLSMVALQAFAATSSLARVQEAALKQQLVKQNRQLKSARSALARQSQVEERLRIAGDLHDGIGHQLTALRLQLEAIAQSVPDELKPQVAASQQLSGDLLENIRSIVKRMATEKFPTLDELIRKIDAETPGLQITLHGELPSLSTELEQQLASCVQEGISNAIRHGKATCIDIGFSKSGVVIDDNGEGVEEGLEPGFGLRNLMTRLEPFNGQIHLKPREPRGSRLSITVDTRFQGGAST